MSRQLVVSELGNFLQLKFPTLPAPVDETTELIEGGAVDSLGVLEIVGFLSEQFGVEIADDDFAVEHFATVGTLADLVEAKRAR